MRRFVIAAVTGWLLATAPSWAAKGSDGGGDALSEAEVLYQQGLRAMKRGYYTRAQEKFNRVRNFHRDDPLSVKAQLAIADMHFKKGDHEQARFEYEEFAALHPRHPNLDYVTYRIGLSIHRRSPAVAGRDLTATKAAVNAWAGFESRFPESTHIDEVVKLRQRSRDRLAVKELFIAKFYAKRSAWGAVQSRAEYMLSRYPDSQHVPEALLLLGTALHAWGDVEAAKQVRARLVQDAPDSDWLRHLDRVLAREPGTRPDERVFIRPYRIRTPAMPGQPPS